VVYKVVAKLYLGLRARWAYLTESSSADVGLRAERRLVLSSLVRPLERTALDLDSLEFVNRDQAPLLDLFVSESNFEAPLDAELERTFILKQASSLPAELEKQFK